MRVCGARGGSLNMSWLLPNLWLIPAMPLLAAAVGAFARQRHRKVVQTMAIGSMALAFLLSSIAFASTLRAAAAARQQVHNFDWFVLGEGSVRLGWLLDPLSASMLMMVSFVGTLIFI